MAYKAPIWEDGKSPAISAENLNALSQAAEGAQVLYGNSAPTSSTEGAVGQFYLVVVADSDGNYPLYQCVAIANGSYTWRDTRRIPDSITSMLGIPAPGTINGALNVLANIGNLYVWARTITYSVPGYTLSDPAAYEVSRFYAGQTPDTGMSIQYASGVSVSSAGIVSLNNPATLDYVGYEDELDDVKALAGKFCIFTKVATIISYETQIPGGVVYIPADAQFSYSSGGGDPVITCSKIQIVTGYGAGETTDYVTSTDSTAYPQDGDVGDYHYTYLGQLGNKVQIELGSYVGTGTGGSANPIVLTFSFKPKIVFVVQDTGDSTPTRGTFLALVYGQAKSNGIWYSANSDYNPKLTITWGENSVSFYSLSNSSYRAGNQMNVSGQTYYYIAIG